LPLEFDCCEVQGKNFSLNNMHLNLPLNNVIHHLDDLKIANHKVEEVEGLTEEQEWKLRHANMDYHNFFFPPPTPALFYTILYNLLSYVKTS
jgi:hypothetical protein